MLSYQFLDIEKNQQVLIKIQNSWLEIHIIDTPITFICFVNYQLSIDIMPLMVLSRIW